MGKIVYLNTGEFFKLPSDRHTLIGRTKSADILINDPFVSARHASILPIKDNFYLVDHSKNGTSYPIYVEISVLSKPKKPFLFKGNRKEHKSIVEAREVLKSPRIENIIEREFNDQDYYGIMDKLMEIKDEDELEFLISSRNLNPLESGKIFALPSNLLHKFRYLD